MKILPGCSMGWAGKLFTPARRVLSFSITGVYTVKCLVQRSLRQELQTAQVKRRKKLCEKMLAAFFILAVSKADMHTYPVVACTLFFSRPVPNADAPKKKMLAAVVGLGRKLTQAIAKQRPNLQCGYMLYRLITEA